MRLLIENIDLITLEGVHANSCILMNGETIEDVFAADQKTPLPGVKTVDGGGAWALAGLTDLHIHGFAGHGPELGQPEELLAMSDALAQHGVTAFCPTLYCARPEHMQTLLEKLAGVIGQEKGARILGFHLEGPFISPAKPGVMKPQDIAPADVHVLEQLYQAARGHIAAMTLAPELENIAPVITFCLKHRILPQAGHTNATYEQFRRGVESGVTHATHAFNAMSPLTQRAPGAAGAVLMSPDVSCEVIADGVHVHPQIISFLRTVKPAGKLVLVTDALLPTGQTQGPFTANGEQVIFEGGVWRRATDHVIAGSALTLAGGIKNLVQFGYPLAQAVRCATYNPARLLGLRKYGKIAPGFMADITLLHKDFTPKTVFIGGKEKGAGL